jgi:hypothetical protein
VYEGEERELGEHSREDVAAEVEVAVEQTEREAAP